MFQLFLNKIKDRYLWLNKKILNKTRRKIDKYFWTLIYFSLITCTTKVWRAKNQLMTIQIQLQKL